MKKYFLTLTLMAATALGTFTLRADDTNAATNGQRPRMLSPLLPLRLLRR